MDALDISRIVYQLIRLHDDRHLMQYEDLLSHSLRELESLQQRMDISAEKYDTLKRKYDKLHHFTVTFKRGIDEMSPLELYEQERLENDLVGRQTHQDDSNDRQNPVKQEENMDILPVVSMINQDHVLQTSCKVSNPFNPQDKPSRSIDIIQADLNLSEQSIEVAQLNIYDSIDIPTNINEVRDDSSSRKRKYEFLVDGSSPKPTTIANDRFRYVSNSNNYGETCSTTVKYSCYTDSQITIGSGANMSMSTVIADRQSQDTICSEDINLSQQPLDNQLKNDLPLYESNKSHQNVSPVKEVNDPKDFEAATPLTVFDSKASSLVKEYHKAHDDSVLLHPEMRLTNEALNGCVIDLTAESDANSPQMSSSDPMIAQDDPPPASLPSSQLIFESESPILSSMSAVGPKAHLNEPEHAKTITRERIAIARSEESTQEDDSECNQMPWKLDKIFKSPDLTHERVIPRPLSTAAKTDDHLLTDNPSNHPLNGVDSIRRMPSIQRSSIAVKRTISDNAYEASTTNPSHGLRRSHSTINHGPSSSNSLRRQISTDREGNEKPDTIDRVSIYGRDSLSKDGSSKRVKLLDSTRRSDRAALPGFACQECQRYYDALVFQGIVTEENREEMMRNCSRHKSKEPLASTDPSFWAIDLHTPEEWKITGKS